MRSPWRVPRRSAGRRARPEMARCRAADKWRRLRTLVCGVSTSGDVCWCCAEWLACAFRRFASLLFAGGGSICFVVGKARAHERVARTISLIRLRAVKRSGGGGPCEAWWRGHAALRPAVRQRPLPPRCARSPLPAPRGGMTGACCKISPRDESVQNDRAKQ